MIAETSSADVQTPDDIYLCPGESQSIGRALHLGRMASFYPACSGCPRRDETQLVSPRRVKLLRESQIASSDKTKSLFHAEGLSGVYLNDIGPEEARRVGQAFGGHLVSETNRDRVARAGPQGSPGAPPIHFASDSGASARRHQSRAPTEEEPQPTILLACDGRPWTVELSAAVGAGLRWAGCRVIDIGAATSPCVALATERLSADGAVLVGNSTGQPRRLGMNLFGFNAEPLSSPGELDAVQQRYHSPAPRPSLAYGPLERTSVSSEYLQPLAKHYHAMRPLRVVVDTTSLALVQYLEYLTATVAIELLFVAKGNDQERLGDQVRSLNAHFGAWIDGDGECCRLVDELGATVSSDQLFMILAHEVLAQQAGATFVVSELAGSLIERLRRAQAQVLTAGSKRSQMHAAVQERRPALAGDAEGRLWYTQAGAAADALRTLTLLLTLLSRSDRPLSELSRSAIL